MNYVDLGSDFELELKTMEVEINSEGKVKGLFLPDTEENLLENLDDDILEQIEEYFDDDFKTLSQGRHEAKELYYHPKEVEASFDYYPEEKMTFNYPGTPETVEDFKLSSDGFDFTDIITEKELNTIEADVVNHSYDDGPRKKTRRRYR